MTLMIEQPSPEVVSSRSAPLFGFWYPAVPSHTLLPGRMKGLQLLGLPIVLCRDRAGVSRRCAISVRTVVCLCHSAGSTVNEWNVHIMGGSST